MTFIKRVNNSDTGDATHWGGDHFDNLDKMWDDTDIEGTTGKPARIKTKVEFRDGKLYIWNGADTFTYQLKAGTIGSNVELQLPSLSANGTLVAAGGANDWGTANQTFRSSNLIMRNPANTNSYVFVTSAITASRNITIPLLTTDDTFLFNNHTATPINKTLHFDTNTFKHSNTNVHGDIYKYDSTDGKLKRLPMGTADQYLKVNAGGTDLGYETFSPGSGGSADKVKVYEGGSLIGTVARKLNFSASHFNVTEDSGNDELDIELAATVGTGNCITIYKNSAALAVANTASEANLFSTSVGAGVMSTNNILHIIISGWIMNDSGGSDGFTFRLKFGGTTLWEDDTSTFSDSSTRRPLHMEFWIKNMNSASAQNTTGKYIIGKNSSATVGFSDLNSVTDGAAGVINGIDSTIATASAQTLLFSVDPSDTHADLGVHANTVLVEMIT